SFARPELALSAERKRGKAHGRVLELVAERPKRSGVIYAGSRDGVDKLAEKLVATGECRQRLRRSTSPLTPAFKRMRCTVIGRTLSGQFGDRCPSRVNTAAISSSCILVQASSSARSRISAPRLRLATEPTRLLIWISVNAPPRQTIRTKATSCSPRSRTTLSTRQRSSALRFASVVLGSPQISDRRPERRMTLSLSALPATTGATVRGDLARANASSAARTSFSAASQ